MRIHHNRKLNFSHATYKKKATLNNVDREIRMGELRLKYVHLMRDAPSFLGDEDANILSKNQRIYGTSLLTQKG